MTVQNKLKRVLALLLEAAARDPKLSAALEQVLSGDSVVRETSKSRVPRNRRRPAVLDPFVVIKEGVETLRARLEQLDMDALKDIVSEYVMDPRRLVARWKDQNRVIEHILMTVNFRSKKGDAFRK